MCFGELTFVDLPMHSQKTDPAPAAATPPAPSPLLATAATQERGSSSLALLVVWLLCQREGRLGGGGDRTKAGLPTREERPTRQNAGHDPAAAAHHGHQDQDSRCRKQNTANHAANRIKAIEVERGATRNDEETASTQDARGRSKSTNTRNPKTKRNEKRQAPSWPDLRVRRQAPKRQEPRAKV